VWPQTGAPCVPEALRALPQSVFPRGGRAGSVPGVALLVTDADTPFDYSDWVDAADQVEETLLANVL